MSKCADSLEHWNTQSVATRVVETVVAGLLILMMAACNVGPNYKRPATSTPQSFRGAFAPEVAAPAQAETSIGDQKMVDDFFRIRSCSGWLRKRSRTILTFASQPNGFLRHRPRLASLGRKQLPSVNGGGSYSALQIPSALAGNKSDGTPANSFFNGGGLSASAAWKP